MLMPGDSPMGYRLPLESLPWATAERCRADRRAGPDRAPRRRCRRPRSRMREAHWSTARRRASPIIPTVPVGKPDSNVVRTSICAEPRNGILHVFMPPTAHGGGLPRPDRRRGGHRRRARPARAHRGLHAAARSAHPEFQDHARSRRDRGQSASRRQLAGAGATTPRCSTRRRATATSTAEKFLLDGRHVGTGGGNHIVLGGATVTDSPLLRRPDLLRSLLGYWQNHPSLSYLFSGMFIGPTSQMPRIDEARNDALYELQLAFDQVPDFGHVPPWLVDRIFRNILTDVTGNTHRAEFCIDKLFDPGSATGRLGLLELRSFEMPPHARMSLDAAAPAARRRRPVSGRSPTRATRCRGARSCTTASSCPHFCAQDFNDVVDDLSRSGYPVQAGMVRAALRVPLPAPGRGHLRRRQPGTAHRARAVARPRRGRHAGRHRPLRRLVGREASGQARQRHRGPARRHLQRPARSAASHRHGGRVRRRRPLPRLAAARGAASRPSASMRR